MKCIIKKLIVSVQNFWYAPCIFSSKRPHISLILDIARGGPLQLGVVFVIFIVYT